MLSLAQELALVSEETAAWLSLARKDVHRAEAQLERALINVQTAGSQVTQREAEKAAGTEEEA